MAKQKEAKIGGSLTDENGNLQRLPNEFFYNEIKLKGYQLQGGTRKPRLFAEYGDLSELEKATKVIQCKNTDLLMKMLKLKDDLPAMLFESSGRLFFDELHPKVEETNPKKKEQQEKKNEREITKAIKKIKNWCESNGFPFKPEVQEEKRNAIPLVDAPGYINFSIPCFISRLNDLYSSFLLYRIIKGQANEIDPTAYISNSHNALIRVKDISADEAERLFEKKYQGIVFSNRLSLKGGLHWEIHATDLFDAAFYQLALLLNRFERGIKVCPLCHEYFVPKNGKQKYCDYRNPKHPDRKTCYPEKAYKRGKLEEKRKSG